MHASLPDHGAEVSNVQGFPWGRFCFFSDPDGNGWLCRSRPAEANAGERLGGPGRPR